MISKRFRTGPKKEIQNPSETGSPKCSKKCRKRGSKKCPETGPQRLSKKCPETGPLYVQKTEPFGTANPRKPLSLARAENIFQHFQKLDFTTNKVYLLIKLEYILVIQVLKIFLKNLSTKLCMDLDIK